MQRLPWDRVLEYRGREAEGYSFVSDKGERVDLAPMLRFEFETDDGDVGLVDIRASAFDNARALLEWQDLKRGDYVRVQGVINLQERGSGKDSYFSVKVVEPAPAPVRTTAGKS
jgi:hypothetical protein